MDCWSEKTKHSKSMSVEKHLPSHQRQQWQQSPDSEAIMKYLRQRIRQRRSREFNSDDELRQEALDWLTATLTDRHKTEPSLNFPGESDWRLQKHPIFSSHRAVTGKFIIWLKRHLVYPVVCWLVEFVEINMAKQDRFNLALLHIVEEMSSEIVRLNSEVADLERRLETTSTNKTPSNTEES